MNELIEIVEEMSLSIIRNDLEKIRELSPKLNNSLFNIFPFIITTYSKPEMKEVSQDALFWPQLLEKIIDVLKSEDRFLIVDTLYYETRGALFQFIDTCKKYGLSIDF